MIKKRMKIMAMAALAFSMVSGGRQQAIAADDMPEMDHSKMGHESPSPVQADDMSGMDHSKMNHEAEEQTDVMKGTDHSSMGQESEMPMPPMQGGTAPADARDPHSYSGGFDFGPIPPPNMADEAYMGGLLVDRLESVQSRDNAFSAYELQGWFGKDYNRLVLKAEGEADSGTLHEARTELLWGHALTTFWDAQLGLRYDSGLAPDWKWLALGVQGLAPYWFEVDAEAYIGEQGRSALRLGAEYELLITQRLIVQPRVEANFYGQQDAAMELGTGLTSLAAGVRMRYEIHREFAPYLGMEWSGKFGGTADYARAAGTRANETRVVAGVRLWY